jgi:hypothetical protein
MDLHETHGVTKQTYRLAFRDKATALKFSVKRPILGDSTL